MNADMLQQQLAVYKEQVVNFFAKAQELHFDPVALFEKEPLMMLVFGGVVFFVLLIVFSIIKKKMRYSGAHKAVQSLDSYVESFEEYQNNLRKILKTIKGAKGEFLENLKEKKENFYTDQLRSLAEEELPVKIEKYQQMATLYGELGKKAKDQELREFYTQKSVEILDEKLFDDIKTAMESFHFSQESIPVLESIVAFANTQDEPQKILDVVREKLANEDFGSSLEIYTFVQNLDAEKLGEIHTFAKEQQDKLFEDGERVVAAEVLEYLLDNGEEEKVYSYIRSLKVPTHLQELYYRFFDQKENKELDFAFMANPLEINQEYKHYVETLITDNWRDDTALEYIEKQEQLTRVIGHDRVRQVIERVDALRTEKEADQKVQEALTLAQEAHKIALETQALVDLTTKKKEADEQEPQEVEAQEVQEQKQEEK